LRSRSREAGGPEPARRVVSRCRSVGPHQPGWPVEQARDAGEPAGQSVSVVAAACSRGR
jgi:hypothetical protein